MTVEIRKGDPADKDAIFQVYRDAVQHMESQAIYQWNDAYPNLKQLTYDLNDEELYVLAERDEIQGAIVLNEYQEDAWESVDWGYPDEVALVIHRLVVHPRAQGQGFAKRLLSYAEEFARSHGYRHIRLDTYAGNPNAVHLYETVGYEKRGEVNFGKELPFYCMDKQVFKV